MTEAKHTPGPVRLHDMERATIVAGRPGDEIANCLNGFGDQDANAAFIVRAWNAHNEMLSVLQQLRRPIQYDINTGKGLFSDSDLEVLDAAIAKATGAA